jgi:hypothetical protein
VIFLDSSKGLPISEYCPVVAKETGCELEAALKMHPIVSKSANFTDKIVSSSRETSLFR